MVFLRYLTGILLTPLLSGCLFNYLVKSGYEQAKILNHREPIETALKRNNLSPELRKKLELTLKIRDFASKKLHLKTTNNYNTFVDIQRPYVTYIVTVAKKWELEPELYWYPILGKLPYKGFFNKVDAENEAKNFDPNKFDVMLRGVSAYSTLGWFDDPLLSSMLSGKDHNLVNLIIHESTHATLYIKSQADFNEQLATFIGNIGTDMYYREIEGNKSSTIKTIANEAVDDQIFSDFIRTEIQDLKIWYQSKNTKSQTDRELKFKEIKYRFTKNILPKMKTQQYANFATAPLNNAVLLYFKTYMYDLSILNQLYVRFDSQLEKFLSYCKKLEKSQDPIKEIKTFLAN